jgi:myo-inositol 2-dehydrogenase/D-chiro-inositol 1-dehydrogenase
MTESKATATSAGSNRPKSRISRREFVTGTVAAGVTVMQPQWVRGTEANSHVEVGIVGLGGRGSLIARLIAEKHPGLKISSVADYFPQVAERVGESLKVPKARRYSGLSGYKKVIGDKVDAIVLETPPCFFPGHACAAVDAGIHVYMAKPVAADVWGCQEILKAGKKAGQQDQVFLVDFQVPTEDFNKEVVKRCHQGVIGEVGMLSSIYCDEAFSDPPKTKTIASRLQRLIWVNDIDLGGGMLVNAGIHAVDAGLWLAQGRPISVSGLGRRVKLDKHGDTHDVYSLTYAFANGLIMNHRGEHLPNTHGFTCDCAAYGQVGYGNISYQGRAILRGNKGSYRGGDVANLYGNGIDRNLDKFEREIRDKVYANDTLQRSVNSTLTTMLGRIACVKNRAVTRDEMIQENQKFEVDVSGLAI